MTLFRYLIVWGAGLVIAMPAAAFTLTLKSSVVATRPYVALQEVAEISNVARPGLLPEIQRLHVALAPKPGQDIRLTREHIMLALRYESPVLASQIKWAGAEAVSVLAMEQSLDLAPVQHMAETALRKALLGKVSDINVQVLASVASPMLPPGPITIIAKSVKPATPSQRMSVEVEVTVDEHYRRTFPVWFSVQGKIDVLVAKTDLGSGTLVDANLFETKRINLGTLQLPVVINATQHERRRMRQNVAAGSLLTQADVEPAPPVNRQQEIAVQLFADGIALNTSGIALSDGEIGKSIRVKNPRSGDVFNALVSAPGVATITVR